MKVRVIESPNFNGVPGLFAFNGKYDDRDTVIFKKGDVIGEYKGEFKTLGSCARLTIFARPSTYLTFTTITTATATATATTLQIQNSSLK